jgi:hypothetical protein
MYPRKTTIHHQSRGDASYHVRQHARMTSPLLCTPFVFRALRPSTHVTLNANGTIWSQWSHVNAVRLLSDQHDRSQLSVYRSSVFERKFVQDNQNFRIMIIKRRFCSAIFITEVLTSATYLANTELNRSKCVSILSKLCRKLPSNVMSIDSLIMKKYNDDSLIMFYPERLVNVLEHTG